MTFAELGLPPELVRAVTEKGYTTPTPIQAQAIPVLLQGLDVVGSAQTGTGKTAAFALPTLARLGAHKPNGPRVLVLEPTRELAAQVDEQFRAYGCHGNCRVALVHGGVGYGPQLEALDAGADIVVATPGRLLDHLEQRNVNFKNLEIIVLDEVDRMLDLGFIDDVTRILNQCPRNRQTLLFSATVADAIKRLISGHMRNPVDVNIGLRVSPADTVDHAVFPVDGIQKYDLLLAMFQQMEYHSVLVFTRTKRDADRIAEWLDAHHHPVTVMHADRSQKERTEALAGFKSGKFDILVATDIAARGLDIAGISHVINYNVPHHPEDYVHRIGRTGRAMREGEAYTLFSSDESTYLGLIEKLIGRPIERRKLEGFAYRTEPNLLTSAAPAAPKRRNRGFAPPGGGAFRRR
jgi:ATP-dependent RNA helicase RhlE